MRFLRKTKNKKDTNGGRPKKRVKIGGLRPRNLKYYIGETLRSIVRNKIMSLTSMATVASCLLIVIFSYAIASNVNHLLAYIETSVGITVFVEDDLNDTQADILFRGVLALDNVADAQFITPEEALENMAYMLGDTEGILASFIYDNPLRRSFTIQLHDIRQQRQVVDIIWSMYGVGNIVEASDFTDFLVTTNNFVGIFSFVIILILGVLSVVIITNTIKLTVASRRNEIIIMKYVGATDWFIKWPFVIEGIFIGVIGAIIPLAISWVSYDNLIGSIMGSSHFLEQLPFRSASDIFPIFTPVTIILGATIGLLGSIMSMRKYLNA
ncbi:MAG: permease-like cell division protein FtsX [Defluviitaleaceae bacterium]|nr:permease-like cell division protein FtsX [Defluviitaleaceae bacterium]